MEREVIQGIMQAYGELDANALHDSSMEKRLAKRWGTIHLFLGIPAAALSAAAGVTGLATSTGRIPVAVVTLVAAVIVASSSLLQPGVRQQRHQTQHAELVEFWHRVRVIMQVDLVSPEWFTANARSTLDKLTAEYNVLRRKAVADVRRASPSSH